MTILILGCATKKAIAVGSHDERSGLDQPNNPNGLALEYEVKTSDMARQREQREGTSLHFDASVICGTRIAKRSNAAPIAQVCRCQIGSQQAQRARHRFQRSSAQKPGKVGIHGNFKSSLGVLKPQIHKNAGPSVAEDWLWWVRRTTTAEPTSRRRTNV